MKKHLSLLFALLMLLTVSAASAQDSEEFTCPEGSAELVVAAGAVGQELELTLQAFDDFKNNRF